MISKAIFSPNLLPEQLVLFLQSSLNLPQAVQNMRSEPLYLTHIHLWGPLPSNIDFMLPFGRVQALNAWHFQLEFVTNWQTA
jgi:hypothetical protein